MSRTKIIKQSKFSAKLLATFISCAHPEWRTRSRAVDIGFMSLKAQNLQSARSQRAIRAAGSPARPQPMKHILLPNRWVIFARIKHSSVSMQITKAAVLCVYYGVIRPNSSSPDKAVWFQLIHIHKQYYLYRPSIVSSLSSKQICPC